MGNSFSSSPGHFSHPDHSARFRRAANVSTEPATCGMCQEKVEFNDAAVYRCSKPGCSFVLHDACYRRRQTIKRHFAHPQQPLTLAPVTGGRSEPSCTLCARRLSRPGFAYSCTDDSCTVCAAAGVVFHSHPRCCSLPQYLSAKHEHERLVLRRPPSRNNGEHRPRQRTCIHCKRTAATTGASAPWSYQCPNPKCDVEQCLACLLGNGGDGGGVSCGCVPCYPETVREIGELVGAFLCGILKGMGCPGIPS